MGQSARGLRSLDRADRASLVGMAAVVVALHVAGFGVLLGLVAPRHYHLGGGHPVFSAGVGLLAYSFGLRHAFDADHIAAVDSATRALLADRERLLAAHRSGSSRPAVPRRPLSVGFWFSLGHSTIVFGLAVALSLGVKALVGPVVDGGSRLHEVTGLVGASVSGTFLLVLGCVNVLVLLGLARVLRDLRAGRYDEAELERRLAQRGLLNRLLARLTRRTRRAWHTYPVGVLFGLGFDTATEVGLLVLAGGAAAFALPFWAVLVLPVLFAAGMCLFDTLDGVLMNAAYGWALTRPVRRIFYNLTTTALSAAVALGIGGIELVGVAADATGVRGGPLGWVAEVDLGDAGFVIVAAFALAWLFALAVWRWGRLEQRWSYPPR